MLKSRRFWLGAIVSVIFLVLFLWRVDLGQTAQALRAANYWWLIPALASYFAAVYFRSLRWHVLLLPMKSIPVRRLYPVVVIGYMANNLLPARLGEFVRSYFAGRQEGMPKAATLATILIERVFDGVFLLLLGLAVWPFLPVPSLLEGRGMAVAAVSAAFVLTLIGFFTIALVPTLGELSNRILQRFLPAKAKVPVGELLSGFLHGFQTLRRPRQVLATVLLTVPIWFLETAMYYLIALGFRIQAPFHAFLLTTSTSNLATSLPTPGGVGPFEYATRITLEALAVPTAAAVPYALVLHVALLVPVTLLGLVFLWNANLSLRDLAKQTQLPEAKRMPTQEAQP